MKSEDKIMQAALASGKALDAELKVIAGERMGFVLLVGPLGREGLWPMHSNLPEKDVQSVCEVQATALELKFTRLGRMN